MLNENIIKIFAKHMHNSTGDVVEKLHMLYCQDTTELVELRES